LDKVVNLGRREWLGEEVDDFEAAKTAEILYEGI